MKNKKYKTHPFEFMFLINGNPIVGRNFPVNNYNRESLNSYEIKETIDDAVELIRDHFKSNTYDYMDRYYNYLVATTAEDTEPIDIYENEDFFTLQIKVKGRVVC